MAFNHYVVVYGLAGNTPTDAMVISQSFSSGINALWYSAVASSSSLTVSWSASGLQAGMKYQTKYVVVSSAGATATASLAFQTLQISTKTDAVMRKRRVLYTQ